MFLECQKRNPLPLGRARWSSRILSSTRSCLSVAAVWGVNQELDGFSLCMSHSALHISTVLFFFFLTELFLSIACEVKVFISSCWNLGITWTGFWLICKSLIWSYVVCSCKVKEILSVKLSKSIWFAFRSNLWFLWVLLCTLSPKPATRNWIRMLVWAKTQTDFHVGF